MTVMFALDVKDGRVVHGDRGERWRYRSPRSRLAADPAPSKVLAAVHRQLGLRDYYVADLDSIATGGVAESRLRYLPAECPWASLWIDAGSHDREQTQRLLNAGYARVIVGLETLPRLNLLGKLYEEFGERVVFSLDLRNGQPTAIDPNMLGRSSEAILDKIACLGAVDAIVLDIAKVGTRDGYDQRRASQLEGLASILSLHVGGGIADLAEAERLLEYVARSIIVATLVYNGALGWNEIVRLTYDREFT